VACCPGAPGPRAAGPRCRGRGSPAALVTGHGAGQQEPGGSADGPAPRGNGSPVAADVGHPPTRPTDAGLDDHSDDHYGGKGRHGAVWGRPRKRRKARHTEVGGTRRDAAGRRLPSFRPGGLSGPAAGWYRRLSTPSSTPNRTARPDSRGEQATQGLAGLWRYHSQNGTGRERWGADGTAIEARPRLS
jgi:hypothetical protein